MRGLYLVTPNWDDTDRLLDVSEQALQEGVALLQYRHKSAEAEQRRERAGALLALAREIWRALHHQRFYRTVRRSSTRTACTWAVRTRPWRRCARAQAGQDRGRFLLWRHGPGTDGRGGRRQLCGLRRLYPSLVKKYAVTTPLDIVLQAKREISLPCVVIGGMTPENAAPLVARGASPWWRPSLASIKRTI